MKPTAAQEIQFRVIVSPSESYLVATSRDQLASEFLTELLAALPPAAPDAPALAWGLRSVATGRQLDPKRTLAQNGVRMGNRLHLAPEVASGGSGAESRFDLEESFREPAPAPEPAGTGRHNEVRFQVTTPNGDPHDVTAPNAMRADQLVRELMPALRLAHVDAEGHAICWHLYSKSSGRELVPEQTLQQNGVRTGHRLNLVRRTVACAVAHRPLSRTGPRIVNSNNRIFRA